MTTKSTGEKGEGILSGVSWRALVLSMTITRGSRRSFQASWPWPTSTA